MLKLHQLDVNFWKINVFKQIYTETDSLISEDFAFKVLF